MELDKAVDLAIDCLLKGDLSDITKASLEIDLIRQYRAEFKADILRSLKINKVDEMGFEHLRYILTPKNRYVFDYRRAAIIQPASLCKFLSIVFQYSDVIEKARVPVSDNVVFSYRFNPNDNGIFNSDVGYDGWKKDTRNKIESGHYKFVVSCDIAAFYDRINIHRIESTLESIGVHKSLVKITNSLLLFWSKKDSYGIPVGNVGSRILAEAALIDIDRYLLEENIIFNRYVDDYKIFAKDLLQAQEWLNKLNMRLYKDGLILNTGKTIVKKNRL